MRATIAIMSVLVLVTGCATQRYGREKSVSSAEKGSLTCREIALQIDSTEEFLSDVRRQRMDTSGAHVLGFFGDFGIGNSMEGDAAELSGENRLKELRDLQAIKGCK